MGVIILIVVMVVGCALGLPIAAFISAARAERRAAQAEFAVERLRARVLQLEKLMEALSKQGVAASVPETSPVEDSSKASTMESGFNMASPPVQPVEVQSPLLVAQAAVPPVTPSPLPDLETEPAGLPPRLPVLNAELAAAGQSEETAPAPQPASPVSPIFDWERFLGVKMFAWVGGLALFLGVGFALKYSFDRGLISPLMRVLMGLVLGLGLLVGGLRLARPKFAVTVQVLCATGALVLYADIFAANTFFHLIPNGAAFGAMTLVTAVAFMLAVHLDAPAVAVLGLAGGFLTPPLLATGHDNPVGLFGYIALLDAGLMAVNRRKGWGYLVLLGAIGTVIMQWGWVGRFFAAEKIYTALAIFTGFAGFFLLACGRLARAEQPGQRLWAAVLLVPASAFAFAFHLLQHWPWGLGEQPGLLFGFAFLIDAGVLAAAWGKPSFRPVQLAVGGVMFALASLWTKAYLTHELLGWALGIYFFFALGHTFYSLVWDKFHPAAQPKTWAQLFPVAAMVLLLLPVFQLNGMPLSIWLVIFLVNAMGLVVACLTVSMLGMLAAAVATMVAFVAWISKLSAAGVDLAALLWMVAGFTVFLFTTTLYALARYFPKAPASSSDAGRKAGDSVSGPYQGVEGGLPVLAVAMPFLLVILLALHLPLANPTSVFALVALLLGLCLGLVYFGWAESLGLFALGGVFLVQLAVHAEPMSAANASLRLGWQVFFFTVFLVFPFACGRRMRGKSLTYAMSALAGPAHLFLVWRAVGIAYPNTHMSLLPLAFAAPYLVITACLWRTEPGPVRNARLAWQAGVALFFITLFVPLEYKRQWLTIVWALEGVALLWLFRRVPHPGLPWVGTALLTAAFVRLAFNQEVLRYYPRGEQVFWTWFLYAYGMVIACLFVGARLLAPPRNILGGTDLPPWFRGMGTLLAFWLLNLEIACHYSTGNYIDFNFSGNLERDMAYSLAWAAFAFVLLVVGIRGRVVAARYAGLALLSVTLLKLFFHDLWSLGGLYRIGALIGLAVVSIPVSYLYQRFMAVDSEPKSPR